MILHHLGNKRRGVVLMVVLAMLTLFAAVGLAFVSYTESEATQAQNQKQSEVVKLPDADNAFNYFLRQVIYDTNDAGSALRGNSMVVNTYGTNGRYPQSGIGRKFFVDALGQPLMGTPPPAGSRLSGIDPYYQTNYQATSTGYAAVPASNVPDSLNPPYTYPDTNTPFLSAMTKDGNIIARSFVRDVKLRVPLEDDADPTTADYWDFTFNPFDPALWANLWNPSNVLTDPVLGARCALIPLPAPGSSPSAPPITRSYRTRTSTTTYIKVISPQANQFFYLLEPFEFNAITLRPNPLVNPNFPAPSSGGDIKQLPPDTSTLIGWNGALPVLANNDSYWLDFGFPVFTSPTTNKKIKALASFFAMDLDGKLSINAHGNTRGIDIGPGNLAFMQHASNMQSQPSDVNLGKVINNPAGEWQQLVRGLTRLNNYLDERGKWGRIGPANYTNTPSYGQVYDAEPNALSANVSNAAQATYTPILRTGPYYSTMDGDGTRLVQVDPNNSIYPASAPFQSPRANYLDRFPLYPATSYADFNRQAEFYHQIGGAYYPRSQYFGTNFGPGFPLTNAFDSNRNFSAANLDALYRTGDTNADALNSEVRMLIPQNFAYPTIRRQLTTHSFTLNRPALSPWRQAGSDKLAYNDVLANRYRLPSGNPIAYPGKPNAAPGGEFATYLDATGTRQFTEKSILTALSQVDLNRPLPDYPPPPTGPTGPQPYDFTYVFPDPGPPSPAATNAKVLQQAVKARQDFATDIYLRLVYATGAFDPYDALGAPSPEQLNALRWLAQLSVNIVDYIDSDDYITCFNWGNIGSPTFQGAYNGEWVYGTELPRLVLNEAYAEARNAPTDPDPTKATMDYTAYNWLELYNPLSTASFGAWQDGASARLKFTGQAWSIYQLYVYKNNDISTIRDPGNVTGTGNTGTTPKIVNLGNNIQFVDPSDNIYKEPPVVPGSGRTIGFMMLGPPIDFPSDGTTPPVVPIADEQDPNMQVDGRLSFKVPFDTVAQNNPANQQAYVLKRLACPYMEPDPNPTVPALSPKYQAVGLGIGAPNPFYNPYITVDYQTNVIINRAIAHNSTGTAETDSFPNRFAYGRMQPYGGNASMLVPQTPDLDSVAPGIQGYTNQPQHTFKRHNAIEEPTAAGIPNGYTVDPSTGTWTPAPNGQENLRKPFDWLTHLDRPLVSPGELLNISSYKPHELTQQFNMALMDPGQIGAADPLVKTTVAITANTQATIQLPTGTYVNGPFPQYAAPNDFIYGTQFTHTWRVQAGDLLVVDTGTQAEVVSVIPLTLSGGPPVSFQAFFTKNHKAGADVSILVRHGHMAPWKSSDTRLYRSFEFLATRSLGVDLGQVRLQAQSITAPMLASPATTDPDTGALLPPELYGTQLVRGVTLRKVDPSTGSPPSVNNACPLANLPINPTLVGIPMNDAIIDLNDGDTLVIPDPVFATPGAHAGERIHVVRVDKPRNRFFATFQQTLPAPPQPLDMDLSFHGGRTSKVNLNTVWDEDTFQGLADAQPANGFYPTLTTDPIHNSIFKRFTNSRRPLITNTVGSYRDRPFLGFGQLPSTFPTASNLNVDVAPAGYPFPLDPQAFPYQKGIEDTWLRSNPLFNAPTTIEDTGGIGLFDYGNLGLDHPYRVNELITKLWNNISSRSNVFAVWITIGFFEYDDVNGIGQELGQLDGRNTRYRFFAVIDRSQLESWVNSSSVNYDVQFGVPARIDYATGATTVGDGTLGLLANTRIDPRYDSYVLPPALNLIASPQLPNGIFQVQPGYNGVVNTQYFTPGQLIVVNPGVPNTAAIPQQIAEVINPTVATGGVQTNTDNFIYLRLSVTGSPPIPAGSLMLQPLPVPRTVLYWTQIK